MLTPNEKIKIDWKKILAVVGGLVILVGIAYLVLWLKPKPSGFEVGSQNGNLTISNKTQTIDFVNDFIGDLSDWKSYRNSKYNFEVKYPNDWVSDPDVIVAADKGQGLFDAGVDKESFSIVYKPEEAVCGHGVGCFYPGRVIFHVLEAPYPIYGADFSSEYDSYVDNEVEIMM